MNEAQKLAVKFFKRYPDKEACHIVMTECFDNARSASSYRKAIKAKKVTVVLKKEVQS